MSEKTFYVGASNPKVVFILDYPQEVDIKTNLPFGANSPIISDKSYVVFRQIIKDLELDIRNDVGVLFVIPEPLGQRKSTYTFKKLLNTKAEKYKSEFFKQLYTFNPDTVIFAPVGALPNQILFKLKNIGQKAGEI